VSETRYILTIRDLDGDEGEMNRVLAYVTTLVGDLGHHEAAIAVTRQTDLGGFGKGRIGRECPGSGRRVAKPPTATSPGIAVVSDTGISGNLSLVGRSRSEALNQAALVRN
jgi:hypothetical protein